jgi:hypothetical protein
VIYSGLVYYCNCLIIIIIFFEKFSRDLRLQNIILDGDAMQIMNVVKARDRNWSNLEQLVNDIRGGFNTLQDWQICHERREASVAGHCLDNVVVLHKVIDQV